MADIIAMFSRWTKSGLSALLDLPGRGRQPSSLDGSSSSSVEATRCSALDDFQRIIRMLPRIEVVLQDAEEREIQDKSVKLWLSELRFLAYDIDDVIDEYEYDVLASQMEARAAVEESYSCGKGKEGDDEHHDEVEKMEVLNVSTSSSSQVPAISNGMAEKLREIRERFDEIERGRKALRLREEDGVRRNVSTQNPRLTSSLVNESSIIGRESEKEELVKLLLSDLESDSNNLVRNKITVIPIVGMGGMGKTTLAQLIYNDPRIHQYFDLRVWIYVSENFDFEKLTKEIYTSITNKSCEGFGFNHLQESIKKELTKFKRTFLVLDDVWNEKQHQWESLKVPFHGEGIVKILLTTRNEKVADVMRTMNSFRLDMFSEDEGLQLFKQCASCDDKNLMEIGKKIVNMCGGLPLAIKLLGSHLRFERDEDKWMSILESKFWDLVPGSSEIIPALRLSYERMPSHLKPCFRYCSIFPKDKMPKKYNLVLLWIAQGYIQPKIEGKTMEEIGMEYFYELLDRSLFQAIKVTDSFKMHDLIYDLAVFISDNEFFIMKLEGGNQNNCTSDNIRHLAIHDQSTNNIALEEIIVHPFLTRHFAIHDQSTNNGALKDTLVHTFLTGQAAIHDQSTNNGPLKDTSVQQFLTRHVALRSLFYYGNSKNDDFQLSDSTLLRAAHIDIIHPSSHLSKFLGSIASLKHLRYIYIRIRFGSLEDARSENVDLSSLCNSLHSIRNIQVLDLHDCGRPIMLPTSIKNLTNLRHLFLPYDSIMPCGISKLTSLQTLKYVVVKDGNHEGGGLGEIEDLASLTGSCCINGIIFAPDVDCFKKANITSKKHIWGLCIDWHNNGDYFKIFSSFDVYISFHKTIGVEKHIFELEEMKLEALQPHKNLKKLGIYNYPGIRFSWWLGDPSYSKLQVITLQGCNEWDGSGGVLDKDLPCLRSISIINCAKLKNITIVQSSSKLYYVCFEDCRDLTSITGLQNLHSLEELKLKRCLKLKLSLEERLSTMLSVLEIVNCPGLEKWCQRYGFKIIQELSKREVLIIKDTSKIISTYGSGNLVSLKELHICGSKESCFPLFEWIPWSLHTLHLNSCQNLMFFPPYKNLSTLRLLKICHCMALTYLPGIEMMESLEKLEIINCPQFALSPIYNFPPKLQFLLVSSCPSLLHLPGLEQLFSLKDLKIFECSKLMLPPPEQLPFMHHVQLELFNSPKLIDWCQRYDIPYNNKESPNDLFVRNGERLEEAYELFENICVLDDYDEAILEIEKWHASRIAGFYICFCVHFKSILLRGNFTRLKQLRIWDCSQLKELDGLHNVTTLQDMDIRDCPNLEHLVEFPKSLQYLAIDRCNKLRGVKFMNTNLSSLEISSCSSLIYLRGLQNQTSLHFLKIGNCPQLGFKGEWMPDMLNPNNVKISACPRLQEWCQKQDVAYYTDYATQVKSSV